eukprot:995964-Pleurochrysis_carterae.AAC.1
MAAVMVSASQLVAVHPVLLRFRLHIATISTSVVRGQAASEALVTLIRPTLRRRRLTAKMTATTAR